MVGSKPGGRVARRVLLVVGATLIMAAALMPAPSLAAQEACPVATPSYTGNCGPTFALPAWGDGAGWNDPSKYSTIQLADINGDGKDELIARNDQGLEIYWFDTTVGQWRPQVDAHGVQQVLTDFASPVPDQKPATDWTKPQYYSTIQTVHLNGSPRASILARFADGIRVYSFTPGPGGSIDGGSWSLVSKSDLFSDAAGWNQPQYYSTIHTASINFDRNSGTVDPTTDLIGRSPSGWVGYSWTGSGWSPLSSTPSGPQSFYADSNCGTPSCYQVFGLSTSNYEFNPSQHANMMVTRTSRGLDFLYHDSGGWRAAGESAWWEPQAGGLFSDLHGGSDCPFPGTNDCLGSSPSYYETLGVANFDGTGSDDVYARAADGLRVYEYNFWSGLGQIPTLSALSGTPANIEPGEWGSIRTGDILGNGRDQVLAIDNSGLESWSYSNISNTWSKLPGSIDLQAEPWLTHPEYYSTIRVGDVDGSGRDAVVARGPFGIRTWFYCSGGTSPVPGCASLQGKAGWTSYLPDGYQPFTTPGQQAAFTALNALAKADGVIPQTASSIRDVWASENAPQPSDLTQLQSGLVSIAGCTGPRPGNPPSFATCTPPSGSMGFTAADWTTVVNEMLAENYDAGQVVAFFAELDHMRSSLFIAENAELPAIGADLGLDAAANTPANFNFYSFFAGASGIAASIAGLFPEGGPLSAALWIVSELSSLITSPSPTAMDTFNTTYAGLQAKFATIVGETQKALLVESQYVRQNGGLLALVSQLRSRGTWAMDTTGMASAANQAFAIWVYQALMPSVYDRYVITQCAVYGDALCYGPNPGTGIIGGGSSFTTLAAQRDTNAGVPCENDEQNADPDCTYTPPPSDLLNRVWGKPSEQCSYVPGNAATAWTFGCAAGVDAQSSIGSNTWNFTTYTGSFDVSGSHCGYPYGSCQQDFQPRSLAPIALGVRGHAAISAVTTIAPAAQLGRATVALDRLLVDSATRVDLARPHRGLTAPPPLTLSRQPGGSFVAQPASQPGVRVQLRRLDRRGLVKVSLLISGSKLETPSACNALPARISLAQPVVELQTRLLISAGATSRMIDVTHDWRCARDATGTVDRLVPVLPRSHPQRGGLAITLHGPSRVQSGRTGRYVAVVYNRRTNGRRELASLWDVTVGYGAGRIVRIPELPRGRSRSLSFSRRAARGADSRFCINVVATAPGVRAAYARTCAVVTATSGPPFTG